MKERLTTLLLALAALTLFYVLYGPKTGSAEPVTWPTTTASGGEGLLAMWRWLGAEGVPVESFRSRYTQLEQSPWSNVPNGNLLVMSLPQQLRAQAAEWEALNRWVQRGNSVLILAALDDTPRWQDAEGDDTRFMADLFRLTGLRLRRVNPPRANASLGAKARRAAADLLSNQPLVLRPRGEHPLWAGVNRVEAQSALPSARWQVAADASTILTLAQFSDDQQGAFLLESVGRGQIMISTVSSLFSNAQIETADNARLLSNIVAWSRSHEGRVIFDDSHQGLTDIYNAKAFFADPRLHRTVWWCLLLWLAFVLGPLRLRSTQQSWQPVDESALLNASGRFFLSTVPRRQAAQRLFDNFFNRLRSRLQLPQDGRPLWEWLRTQSALSAHELEQLQQSYQRLGEGRRVALVRLHNLLIEVQGKLV